ncbi:DUF881 domain-containing protein [Syntrophomonas palmitatica]|uniref:DUF881 domain-containing protein n=1 Tax=Syntrophomonas palmitatica TaxID=402877 RepID=UPI0006D04BC6|nr:DUF881 domain-containing protein [Syntrophomonas palmitatica]
MRTKGAQITIACVCLVLGIMLAIQFRTTATYTPDYSTAQVDDLAYKLKSVTEERDALAEEVLSLREKLKNVRENNQATADLQDEVQKSSLFAGILPVEGKGIILTVDDNPRTLQPGENPDNVIVHDRDILYLVNELKASGAEAIAINGERITAMSEIRCAGTQILVNTNRISTPFVFKAIGNPDMLENGMKIRGGWLETMSIMGFQTRLQKADKLELPAYNGRIKFEYVKPLELEKKAE